MLVYFLLEKKTIFYAGCLTPMYFIYALGNIDSCLLVVMAFDCYVAICDPFHYVTIMSCPRCVLLVAFSCSLPHFHSLLHILLLNQLTFCDSNIIHHVLCDLSPLIKLSCSPTFVNAHYGNTLLWKHLLCLFTACVHLHRQGPHGNNCPHNFILHTQSFYLQPKKQRPESGSEEAGEQEASPGSNLLMNTRVKSAPLESSFCDSWETTKLLGFVFSTLGRQGYCGHLTSIDDGPSIGSASVYNHDAFHHYFSSLI